MLGFKFKTMLVKGLRWCLPGCVVLMIALHTLQNFVPWNEVHSIVSIQYIYISCLLFSFSLAANYSYMLAGVSLLLANIFILASLLSYRNGATIIISTLTVALKFYLVHIGELSILHRDLSKGKVSIFLFMRLWVWKNHLWVYIKTRNRHKQEKNTTNYEENT